jgi:hypothetical protein
MKKQTIEVEGLPEGYRAIAYRKPLDTDLVFLDGRVVTGKMVNKGYEWLVVEKIKPREIRLVETDEVRKVKCNEYYLDRKSNIAFWSSKGESIEKYTIVREVKETDIPLTNDEPKLSLSVGARKPIYVAVANRTDFDPSITTAVCDDGTIWEISCGVWERLPEIPQGILIKENS